MKRTIATALALTLFSLAASGAGAPPKGKKPSPTPIPSEMPTFQKERAALGQMFLNKGDFRQAEQEFRSATRIDPTSVPAAVGLADALYGRKLYQESLDEYMRAMRLLRPSFAVVPLREASNLVAQKKIMDALRIYRKVSHINPKAGEMLNKGIDAQQRGDKSGAKKAFQEAIKIDKNYADAYYKLGNLAYEDKLFGDAVDAYESATKADSSDGLLFFKLGNAFYRFQTIQPKGDKYAFYKTWDKKVRDKKWSEWCIGKAAVAYRQANKLRPKDFDIMFNTGITEYYLKRWDAAIQLLTQAVLIRNDDPSAHTYLGNAWFSKARTIKEYNKAIHEYRVAQNLDPKRWDLEYDLGEAYLQKSKLHPQSDEYEITPANAQFYYAKGSEYHKTHMLEEAAKHFEIYLDNATTAKNREEVTKQLAWIKAETSRSVQGGHNKPEGGKGKPAEGGHGGH